MKNKVELERFEELAKSGFGVKPSILIKAIRFSPSTQGNIDGAVSELLLRELLNLKGYETKRIIEKWKGSKPLRHHGDFYLRKKGLSNWYVIELKGLKSNSEVWHKLNEQKVLFNFLDKVNKNLRIFASEEEIRQWCQKNFEGDKRKLRIRVLETHFVASRNKDRKIATSRNDEFDYIAVDLFLRTGKHNFIFTRPKDLIPAKNHPNHLQQNYIIDVLLANKKEEIKIQEPWHKDLDEIFDVNKESIKEEEMQINERGEAPGLATGPWLLS